MRFLIGFGGVQGVSWFVGRIFCMFVEVELLVVAAMPPTPLEWLAMSGMPLGFVCMLCSGVSEVC